MKWILFTTLLATITGLLGWGGHTGYINDTENRMQSPGNVKLIKNMDNSRNLPPSFRLTTSAYQRHIGPTPTRKGLNKLNASASGQFSKRGLKSILKLIPADDVMILDLRRETHGFLDGSAVSWYGYRNYENVNKTPSEIETIQNERLIQAKTVGNVRIFDDKIAAKPRPLHVNKTFSEKDLADHYDLRYVRFYVTDHHRPDDATVDQFIELVRQLPEDMWIHFHCAGGKGRATTFITMYDMIRNSRDVSIEDIIRRQHLLGGSDLYQIRRALIWKNEPATERLDFVKRFYEYTKANPNLEMSWSEFIKLELPKTQASVTL
ncbi:MAG: hypothetical protein WC222_11025 [Parachlamydiales bacterium]|jgi:hypothetical protein